MGDSLFYRFKIKNVSHQSTSSPWGGPPEDEVTGKEPQQFFILSLVR